MRLDGCALKVKKPAFNSKHEGEVEHGAQILESIKIKTYLPCGNMIFHLEHDEHLSLMPKICFKRYSPDQIYCISRQGIKSKHTNYIWK